MTQKIIVLCAAGFIVSVFLIPILHASRNKHFMVVIPSRNNSQWCERNLEMLRAQSYENWHAIYINDASGLSEFYCDTFSIGIMSRV